MEHVKEKILDILKNNKIGVMTTVHNEQPYSRYMTFTHEEFTLFTRTPEDSEKVLDLQKNPYTHILLGYTNTDPDASYIEIEAKVTDFRDDELKLKIVNTLRSIFQKENDMIAIQIEPIRITLHDKKGTAPQTVDFPLQ